MITEFDMDPAPAVGGNLNILAIDLGTHCGFALSRGGVITYGTKNFSPRAKDGPGQRWLRFRAMLGDHYNASGELHAIYYEDVKNHKGILAAHCFGGFLAHLQAWADVQRVRLVPVGVGEIKRAWTGKGNSPKEIMIAEAYQRGFKPADDNSADALAILHLAMTKEGM